MISKLYSDDVSVADLFNGLNLYEIPAFQREFSWTEVQAQKLYEDILAAHELARQADAVLPMFLGTMLFVASDDPQASVRSTLVVDGQQRLVTLTILLSVLRDYVAEPRRAELHRHIALLSSSPEIEFDAFHLRARPTDSRYLQRAIQRPKATRLPRGKSDMKPSNEAQRRMEAVRALFAKRIKATPVERRFDLARYILGSVRVLRLWAPDIDYAYRLFLSINKPGLPLTDEDIVLAEVVGPLAVEQRRRYDIIIAQMSRYREPVRKGKRRDKTFFTHLALAQGWARSDRMITLLRREVTNAGGPMRFAATVFEPMAQAYLMTRGDWPREALPETVWERLDRLRVLELFCDSEWVAPAMLALQRLAGRDAELIAFLEALDRFAHMLVLTRPTAEERRQSYRPVIEAMLKSDDFPDPGRLFPRDPQREAAALRRAGLRCNDAANGAEKAILIRLDAHVSGRPVSDYLELIDTYFVDDRRVTLEHVLPYGSTLAKTSGWRPEFAQIRYRRSISASLANLILLEADRNGAAGQADFALKKRAYFPDDTLHPLYLTEQIRACDAWTRETLEARYRFMMAALQDLFGFAGEVPDFPPPPGSALPETAPGLDEKSPPRLGPDDVTPRGPRPEECEPPQGMDPIMPEFGPSFLGRKRTRRGKTKR